MCAGGEVEEDVEHREVTQAGGSARTLGSATLCDCIPVVAVLVVVIAHSKRTVTTANDALPQF